MFWQWYSIFFRANAPKFLFCKICAR